MRNVCSECTERAYGRGLCKTHYDQADYAGTLPTTPPPRPCEQCGTTFSARKWNARYCSRKCNDAAANGRRRVIRKTDRCRQCGADLSGLKADATFCSPVCSNRWRNAASARRRAEAKAGKICVGCGGEVSPTRRSNATYCSTACKTASRRHETYGLTKAGLEALLRQHARCAICGTRAWGPKGPQVDHCHLMGNVRGILCSSCNQGLGRFRDNPVFLRAAADYVETHALADHTVIQE